jgi:gliding motility-associated-like protein
MEAKSYLENKLNLFFNFLNYNKHFIVLIILSVHCFNLSAQTYVFAQLNGTPTMNTTGWNVYGNAYVGDTPGDADANNDELVLTDDNDGQSGSVFFTQQINLSICTKWAVEFDYRINDGDGADGLAFCFLDVPPTGFVAGAGNGIPATANGLKVIFDVYDNGCGTNPELQIYNGVGYNECASDIVKVENIAGSLSFVRNGSYQPARITYDNGLIELYINGVLRLTTNSPVLFAGYMGFTASTGGRNDKHSIKNVKIFTPQAASEAGSDQVVCAGTPATIGATGIPTSSYLWSPSIGLSDATAANPIVTTVNTTGVPIIATYVVATSLSSNPGVCPTFDTIKVTINPQISTNVSHTNCGSYVYNGATVSSSGVYTNTFPSTAGCDSIVNLNLTIIPTPNATAQTSYSGCMTDDFTLTGAGLGNLSWYTAASGGTYLGSGSAFTLNNVASNTTVYFQDSTCVASTARIPVVITVVDCKPVAQMTSSGTIVCVGSDIQFNDVSTNNPTSWRWNVSPNSNYVFIDSDTTSQNVLFQFSIEGTYVIELIATNSYGSSSTTQTITVVNSTVQLNYADTTLNYGNSISLVATGNSTGYYNWTSDNTSLSETNILSLSPVTDEIYTVEFTNEDGCAAIASIVVSVVVPQEVGVPDGFTPNNDGNNDVLYVRSKAIKTMNFKVFDRLGEVVFQSVDSRIGWDGSFKGVMQNPATFVYVLEYTLVDGTKGNKKGSVSLIK